MRLSDRLFEAARTLWDEACDKAFVVNMAKGTLDIERFKYYMIQDYLYLYDYIELLEDIRDAAGDSELAAFLENTIRATKDELMRVHIPNMQNLGIDMDVASKTELCDVFREYISYMKCCVSQYGLLAGLTALLQCSWCYAYIAEKVASAYAMELKTSPYKEWFDAYTCQDYIDANQAWIEAVDRMGESVDDEIAVRLVDAFVRCAEYENEIWDVVTKSDKCDIIYGEV